MMAAAAPRGPMPPWHRYSGFLGEEEREGLVRWALEQRETFKPSKVVGGIVDPERRISEKTHKLGAYRAVFEQKIGALLPDLFRRTGTRPFEPESYELELVAHGDGAYFAPHTDIPVGPGRKPLGGDASGTQDRLLSGVYYFHREPKAFSGGALRFHRFGGGETPEDWVDVEPEQDSFVVFPTWARHEVLRVSCPSREFADSRFAVNVWLCRALT
jgi:Rps23 Pro-64 3,4-dihydroxylase Tpa1-like proline 4-hydroxylase